MEYIGPRKKTKWTSMVDDYNEDLVNDDVIDLLSKMLVFDHNERITPKEALKHRYFDPVREN